MPRESSEVGGAVQKKLKFWMVLALLRGLALLPWSALEGLGAIIGYCLWRFDSRERRIAAANIALCLPQLSAVERAQLERATLIHFGRVAAEIAKIWFGSRAAVDAAVVAVEGEELLTGALAEGRGVIILAPHHGNWEMLGSYLGRHHALTTMYLPAKDEAIDAVVRIARMRSGAQVAPANAAGVRTVLKVLKQGGLAGMLPDQVPKQAGAEFAPFFGQQALTMTLPGNLLQKTAAKAVFGCAFRVEHGNGFRIVFRAAPAEIYSPAADVSLAALNRGVEELVRECPQQYQWEYKRFKIQPEGVPRRY
ncbi:MAG TPA: lysophospholipid acyltransferase family protein [Spongiibacteraceae bacterium]|nr:lysophospholipid acyltransferase family protein [Spongiibacteraceae bacterium]